MGVSIAHGSMLIPTHTDRDRLIVALDVPNRQAALQLVRELDGVVSFFKVGYQLFVAEGMQLVRDLVGEGRKVFLDLKLDDVEETITLAVREIVKWGVEFLTIHGNGATARAAQMGRGESDIPRILQVTALSSLDTQDLRDLGIVGKRDKRFKRLEDYVLWRASQSIDAGCEGLIASGTTIGLLREHLGPEPIIVAPGIRPVGTPTDDHKRTATPRSAIAAGADYLVVGRPIRNAPEPMAMARSILDEMEQGLGANV